MSASTRLPQRSVFGAWFLALSLAGCERGQSVSPATAAAEKPKVESDLSRTTLSAEAWSSLGIRSEPARTQKVRESLPLTGWIMAKPGQEVTVTAPVAGYVREPTGGKGVATPGLPVKRGQELFLLEPVLTPVEEIQLASLRRGVESEVTKARESIGVANLELQRVADLHRQKLRGDQDLEQAKAKAKLAQEDLAAAEDKRKLFADPTESALQSQLRSLSIRVPRDGTLLTLLVSPGQYVTAAAPLVLIADLSELWVKVPVPEYDLLRVDRTQPGFLERKTTQGKPLEIAPVALVPLVDPVRHTSDMLYRLQPSAKSPTFARDQMVTVRVPLNEEQEETVVPYSAVVYDAYAGAWIYLDRTPDKATEHLFERKRVELGATIGDGIVIHPACQPGERVVVSGAAAIFSREFHRPPKR